MTEEQQKRMQRLSDLVTRHLLAALGPPCDDEFAVLVRNMADVILQIRLDLAGLVAFPNRAEMIEDLTTAVIGLGLDKTENIAAKTLRQAGIHLTGGRC
jgi:hypothetical protein